MKPGWRRILRVFAMVTGALAVVLVLLHTPPVKDAVRSLLVSATGGRLSIGRLDYRLWRGEVRAHDLAWTSPTLTARCPELVFQLVPLGPDRVTARAPNLELSLGGGGEGAGSSFAIPALLLGMAVELEEGAFSLDAPWGAVTLRSIHVKLAPSLRGWEGSVAGATGTVRLAAFAEPVELDGAEARVVVSRSSVEIPEVRASSGASSFSAEGEISGFSPFSMELDARHDVEGELLARIDPTVRVSGEIEGDAHLRLTPGEGFRAEGTARSPAVAYGQLEPIAATVPWSFERDVLSLRGAELTGYGGGARFDGTVDLASETQSIEATARDIELARFEPSLASRLSGTVSARTERWSREALVAQASIELSAQPSRSGLPLRGRVTTSTERGLVRFDAPELRARDLSVAVSGRFDETLHARFRARDDRLDALPVLLSDLGLRSPGVPVAGGLAAEGDVSGPLGDLVASVSATSSGLEVGGVALALEGRARWSASRSRLTLESVEARQAGDGVLAVEGTLPTGPGGGPWDLSARARSFDLSVATPLAGAPLRGSLDGAARVTGPAGAPRIEADVAARALDVGGALLGDLSGTLRAHDRTLEIVKLSAARDGGEVEIQGAYDLDAGTMTASGRGTGWELDWIPPLAEAVPELTGTISRLELDVEGRLEAPEGRARVALEGLVFRGADLPSAALVIDSDGERARVEARLAAGERLLTGDVELRAPFPARLELDVGQVPWTSLVQTVAELQDAHARLEMKGNLELQLPLSDPRRLSYGLEADSMLATYRDVVFGASTPFSIHGDLDRLTVSDLSLVGADTAVGLDGVVPLDKEGAIDLSATGALRLELLQLWVPESEPAGRANAALRVGGTLAAPTFQGDVVVEEASFVAGGVPVRGVDAAARFVDDVLVLQHASGSLLEGSFRVNGEIAPRPNGEIHTRLELEVAGVDPTLLVANETELPLDSSRLSLSGELEGDARHPSSFSGEGNVTELKASAGSVTLASSEASSWSLTEGALTLAKLRIAGGSTDVVLSARARPFADPPTFRVSVDGAIDHGLASPLLSESGITVSGLTRLSVTVGNERGSLQLEGEGSWDGARVALQEPPLTFTNVTGGFELEGDRIVLNEVTASAGGGQVEASGEIALSGASIGSLDLKAQATQIRLSYPEGLRSELDAELRLTGTPEAMRLSGEVTLDRAVFSRNINIESELLRSFSSVAAPVGPRERGSSVSLDLTVRASDSLRIDNNLAQVEATANLTVAGTLAAPELYGVASTQQGGRFRFGRNIYQIETGRIQFRGYPQQPPEIDVTARTSVSGHDLRLSASGTTDNLVTNLDAPNEPGLTRADVASLLLSGRTASNLSNEGRAIIGEQMASYLGSTLADLAQLGLGEALPFQITTVEPTLIAREVDPGARFTIGASLTEDLTVVYSIGLTDAEQQYWIVDYALPKRARAQIIRQDNNEYTFGGLQQLPLYLHPRPETASPPEQRAVVASSAIVYQGEDRPESAEELERELRPKPGSRYDYWKVWEEADRLRRRLRDEGYLEATVDVATPSCGERCVDVRYQVDLGLPVAFLWEGGVDEELGDALADAWNGRLGESFLTSDLEQLANGELFARGYFLARAEASTQRTDQGLTVTVSVNRGPRGSQVAVSFEGNAHLDRATLLAALPKRRSAAFYDLLTTKRPRLKQQLRLVYASQGYLGAQIGDPSTSFDEASGVFRVTIPVTEGPQYRVETIDFEGVKSFDETTLRALMPLRVGGAFRATDFVDSRSAIAAYYRQQGFPDVRVEASVVDGSDAAVGALGARFVVDEGGRATVGTVRVAGNEATRESVIRRQVELEPGEPLRLSDVSETQKRLYDLGVFRSAEVVVGEPEADNTKRDVTVRVIEAADLRLNYGLRAGTDGFFEVLGEINAPNLFGRAQHAGLRALVGSERQIYRINYHSPLLSRFRLDTDFFVERAYEGLTPEAALASKDRKWTFTAQQTRALRDKINAQWSYTYQRAVSAFDDPFFGPTQIALTRSFITTSVIGDGRDSVVRPTRGTLWSSTFQVSPELLGSDARFVKLFSQLFAYVPFGDGFVWASGYRVGLGKLLSNTLLAEDRFQAGGPNTVRGFAQGSLGPVNEDRQEVIGGAGLLVFNQELRFPLFWKLRGAGFWDAGNTFETVADMNFADLRQSVGAGVRFGLPFGLLRFDLAWVVAPRPGEKPWRFVFSLGQAF